MPNSNWMNDFTHRDDLTLCDITFPASHDAGLHAGAGGFTGYGRLASQNSVVCQQNDIAWQLGAGSRAFDLRFANRQGTVRTFHGEGAARTFNLGGWGQDATSIFDQVDAFLLAHPGEIVILRISHTQENVGVHNLILDCINEARRYHAAGGRDLATVSLDQLQGKAIALFDETALGAPRPNVGLWRFTKYAPVPLAGGGLRICGKYASQSMASKTAAMEKMVKQAIECGNEHIRHPRVFNLRQKHDHLFMVYWQLAHNVQTRATRGGALPDNLNAIDENRGTHYNLAYLLDMYRGQAVAPYRGKRLDGFAPAFRRHRPNWINLDFINDAICNRIIDFNIAMLPPQLP